MINRLNFTTITVLMLLSTVAPVYADSVEITGGQVIQGKLISVDGKVARIKSNQQNVVVPRDSIVRIILDKSSESAYKPSNIKVSPPVIPQPEVKAPEVSNIAPVEDNTYTTTEPVAPALPPLTGSLPPSMAEDFEENGIVSNPVPPITSQPELRPGITIPDPVDNSQPAQPEYSSYTPDNPDLTLPSDNTPVTPESTPVVSPEPTDNNHFQPDNSSVAATTMPDPNVNLGDADFGVSSNLTDSARNQLIMDYITFIDGNSSKRKYFGIYSNESNEDNLTIHLSDAKVNKLSFKLHAQKNGKVPPLYTSSSIIFFDNKGNIISTSNPVIVDSDKFIEWFKNLDNIAGITGAKNVEVNIPQNTAAIKIIGFRPGSKNNLVGYISDIRLDNAPLLNVNKL